MPFDMLLQFLALALVFGTRAEKARKVAAQSRVSIFTVRFGKEI
jgi:hypothetical protein